MQQKPTHRVFPGIDYHETFSPNLSNQLYLCFATTGNSERHACSKKDTLIDCEIFMEQPAGYERVGKNCEMLMCRLNKFLCGLMQSARNWNNINHLLTHVLTFEMVVQINVQLLSEKKTQPVVSAQIMMKLTNCQRKFVIKRKNGCIILHVNRRGKKQSKIKLQQRK